MEDKLKVFNIMDVFKVSTSETTISAFLAWILNPKEDHGCGDYFLKYFLIECAKGSSEFSVIQIDSLDLKDAIVKTEENFVGRKADITIRIDNNKFFCLVENKIFASESEGQTEIYVKYSKKKYSGYNILYIFLTPSGKSAVSDEFVSISYQEIKSLLLQTITAKENVLNEEIIFLINQFIQNLEVNILDEGEIPDLCKEIYERHKEAIDKIISYKPDHIKIIEKELLKLLDKSWTSHSTKNNCYIFKEEWHKDFFEFFTQQVPFFFYLIYTYTKESLCIDVDLYLDERKEKGGLFDLRDKFTEILDGEIKANRPETYIYLRKNKAVKFKKMTIENGYDSEDELINVALEMKNLIDETITPLENTIKIFKEKFDNEIIEWKEKL